jgi:hypothetical protein
MQEQAGAQHTISNPGTMLSSVFFTDNNTGYAVGDNNAAVKKQLTQAQAGWL